MKKDENMARLEKWLAESNIPEEARICITNFVMSCHTPDAKDLYNFVRIDIRDFDLKTQSEMVEGFLYTYFGQRRRILAVDQANAPYGISLN